MHRLLSKDVDNAVGECTECGTVTLYKRFSKGKPQYRCLIAVELQRDSPNRYRNWHGLPSAEARKLKDGAVCSICGDDSNLVIDHCHETQVVRDILCNFCNSMIGFARDRIDLLAAGMQYLEKHKVPVTE